MSGYYEHNSEFYLLLDYKTLYFGLKMAVKVCKNGASHKEWKLGKPKNANENLGLVLVLSESLNTT